jgi:hypothetical protein
MNILGYVFMIGSWTAIIILMFFCLYKEMKNTK